MQDITISPMNFDGAEVRTVNARDLHAFLGVRRDFTNWIKGRIKQYGFIEGVDFVIISRSPELASGNRGAATDYHVTIGMAKELAMVERTPKGREVRLYFIECERVAKSAPSIGLEIHQRIMAYHAQDKVTSAMAKLGSRSMNDRKAALKDLREEYRLLEGIAQLQLFLAGV